MRKKESLAKFATLSDLERDLFSDPRIYNFLKTAYLYALSDYTYIKRDMVEGFNQNLNEILRNIRRFYALKNRFEIKLGKHEVREGDARELQFKDGEIDGIITSSPYAIAVDYIKNDLHALEFLDVDIPSLRENMVGLRGEPEDKVKNYYVDMEKSIDEMYRVLKNDSYSVIVIGDTTVNGKRLQNNKKFIEFGEKSGFAFLKTIRRPILGGFARLRYEYVILFKKGG